MTVASGTNHQCRIKRQTVKGAMAGASLGQILRRESSNFDQKRETFTTDSEINSIQQIRSSRHGAKMISGSIDGLLSPGTYADPISAIVRKDFAAVTSLTALAITIAGSLGAYTLTSTGFLAGGIKVGMIVRITAGTALNADVLNKNLLVTAVTATVITCTTLNGSTITIGSGTACTLTIPGKVTYVPETAHTNVYHTVEEWYPDLSISEQNLDVKFTKCDITLPGNGNAKIKFSALGLDQTVTSSAYFTSPTAETTTEVLTAAGGYLLVNGVSVATVTDLSISIDGKSTIADPNIGTIVRADIFNGPVSVTGSFSAYFESEILSNLFLNETSTNIVCVLTNSSTNASEFMTFSMSNININSATHSDNQQGVKRTYEYVACFNSLGGAAVCHTATTIQIQDSQAA